MAIVGWDDIKGEAERDGREGRGRENGKREREKEEAMHEGDRPEENEMGITERKWKVDGTKDDE